MKKHIKADKEELKVQIEKKYGINLETYKNPEIVAKIGDMILFHNYAYKNIFGPLILALLCFIASFFVLDMSAASITIYIILGLIFWLLFGVFSGINYFLYRIKTDVRGLVNFGFELTKKSLNDLKTGGENVKNEGAGEIFKGVMVIVIIPSVTEAIAGQIPLVGSTINELVNKILLNIGKKMKFEPDGNSEASVGGESKFISIVDKAQISSDTVLKSAFGIVQLPFKVLWFIFFIILLILIILL